MKAEFLYQYQKTHGVPLRSKAFAYINELNQLGSIVPGIANFFLKNALTGGMMKSVLGVASQRNLPEISPVSLRKWYKKALCFPSRAYESDQISLFLRG